MARLIDSSALITLERRGLSPDTLERLVPAEPGAIATITASELLVRVYRATSLEHRQRREAFGGTVLAELPILPFDLQVARVHAQIFAELASTGSLINAHDLLIAATALTHNLPVLTENVRDFERVRGLVVQRPDW
jgi:predicted nucleic acid-binding protein